MRTSTRAKNLIKKHEGLRLQAYRDPVGIWTIGWGHTSTVKPGMEITREQAEQLLNQDITTAEGGVRKNVKVPLSQGQFDALVSFVFNLGEPKFRGSTLLRLINQKNYQAAQMEFPRWVHGGGIVLPGLITRREDERKLFLS